MLAPDQGQNAIAITLLRKSEVDEWLKSQPETVRALAAAEKFKGKADSLFIYPDATPGKWAAAAGLGDKEAGRWSLAVASEKLPAGTYRIAGELPTIALHGWLMGQYRFDRYKKASEQYGERVLLAPNPSQIDKAITDAEAVAHLRDMVNTPADDFGPAEIETEIRALAEKYGARVNSVVGDALLQQNFPAIHAVGRASPRHPRLVTLEWGEAQHPQIALVGKGVCFDTGGLNLKPGNSMSLMKKDMGGAAHAVALAAMIMARRLPVRVKLAVAAVDNAVSGGAMRPGDVLPTRKGLTVEVGNTDAEGRLVLADALAFASEAKPELLLNFATLTGAARVALGPDLPALFSNDDKFAADILSAGMKVEDELWQLPLWQPYQRLFRSSVADLNNNSDSGFAGAIVGGLFLEKFVPADIPWAHVDLYAWNPTARPGRPKGAAAMAIHACLSTIQERFS